MASRIIDEKRIKSFKDSVIKKIDEAILTNRELQEYSIASIDIPAWFVRGVLQRGFDHYTLGDTQYNVVSVEKETTRKIKIVLEDSDYKFRFVAWIMWTTGGALALDDYNPNGPVPKHCLLDTYTINFNKAYAVCSFKVINMTEEEFNSKGM